MLNLIKHAQKPSLRIVLATALGLALAGCTVSIFPGGSTGGSTSTTISNLSFTSNYQDSSGQSYICDNTTTQLTYTFVYNGPLDSWTSALVGEQTGQTAGMSTLYLGSPGVNASGNYVSVTYNVPPNAAPLSLSKAGGVKPQSIIVTPNVKGYTDLQITFYDSFGNSGSVRLSRGIPVQDC